jgi:hemoglobin-like flavoprotein
MMIGTSLLTTLMAAKLFATAKGKGVLEAWQAAVDDLNSQVNKATCCNIFNLLIAVKTVCDWFDNAMKRIAEISAAVPFHSGCDNHDTPNSLQSLLEDLSELKVSFEQGQQGQKLSALTQKKSDWEAAKSIQEAAIGWFLSLLSSDYEDTDEDG